MEEILAHALKLDWFKGYLAKDPEISAYDSGKVCCSFSLPLQKSKDDKTVWLQCRAWGEVGEFIADNFAKGSCVLVCGTLQKSEYNGKTYITLNVVKCWSI